MAITMHVFYRTLWIWIEESVDVREAFINPLNPALFGPYNTRGGADLPPSIFLFS